MQYSTCTYFSKSIVYIHIYVVYGMWYMACGIWHVVDLVFLLLVVAMRGMRTPLWGVARCDGACFVRAFVASGQCQLKSEVFLLGVVVRILCVTGVYRIGLVFVFFPAVVYVLECILLVYSHVVTRLSSSS